MQKPVLGLQPGSLIQDTYRIDALLGEGGMGATFRATNMATGHPVAIKVMAPNFAGKQQAIELFRRESTLLRSVRHDAVVRYETTLQDREGRLYLVMEFVGGNTLKHYLTQGKRLASRDVLTLGLRLAQGLAAIHALGIVHRDIAPDNIMIPDDDIRQAKLIDLGLASSTVGTDQSIIGRDMAGKLDFFAPEQFGLFDHRIGPATDVYALGLVLMKVAGLPVPGEGKGIAALEDRRNDLVAASPRVSDGLRIALADMLRADPARRRQDLVQMFQDALVRDSASAVDPRDPALAKSDKVRTGGPRPAVLIAAVALVACLAVGAWFLLASGKPGVSTGVETARATLQADSPLQAIEALIATGGPDNLNAALGALIKFLRDDANSPQDRGAAAIMVARMYDPETHDPARSPLAEPDAAAARRYYEQAANLGAADAAAALARLARATSP